MDESSTPISERPDRFQIEIADEADCLPVDQVRLKNAVQMILEEASVAAGRISIAVVDDQTIRRLHRQYLDVDEPTDVLSFPLESDRSCLEGEVIVSAQTAQATAPQFGWSAENELLLYVIHGTLHLVGYDDTTDEKRTEMRRQEKAYLRRFGLEDRLHETI